MGVQQNIGAAQYPTQSGWLLKRVDVVFHHDPQNIVEATILRDDTESPFVTILQLEDGRVVLGTECQYGVPKG